MKTNIKTIEQKVLKFIDSHSLINPNDKILLALSGGADSVFAFYLLIKYQTRLKIEFSCAHLNHGLRGKDSDEDEVFCSELCKRNGIKFFSEKKDVKVFAEKNALSIEEAGRELRYDFFDEIVNESNQTKVFTAHHQSDNAETILYNFFKGAGLKGLTGIPEKRGNIIRPLLCLTRDEIEFYLNENEIEYRVDKSNFENDYKRNLIRNELLPLIKKEINPVIENTLSNNSEIIKSSYRLIDKYLKENSEEYCFFNNEKLEFLEKSIQEKGFDFFVGLVKYKMKEIFGYTISSDEYFTIKNLVENQPGKMLKLKNNFSAVKTQNTLVIEKYEIKEVYDEIKLQAGERIGFGNVFVGINECDKDDKMTVSSENEIICADNLDNIFILRRWKDGDYFFPLGMKGRKKVSDFLTDLKVPSHLKKSQLVLTNNKQIVWVVGYRLDDRYKINLNTKKVLKLWKQ